MSDLDKYVDNSTDRKQSLIAIQKIKTQQRRQIRSELTLR